MTRYAQGTTVSTSQSRAEVERTLIRYGATEFVSGWSGSGAQQALGFTIHGRQVRITLPLPERESFNLTPKGYDRAPAEAEKAYQAEIRRRWRALLLIVKAKLEAVDSGITTIEREFLADVVIPDTGETFMDRVGPGLERLYAEHGIPELLPGGKR